MNTIINNSSSSGNIDNLMTNIGSLVLTNYMTFFNSLLNLTIYNVYTANNQLNFQQNNKIFSFDFALSKLPDVKINNLINGDVLVYDGTNFINNTISDFLNYSSNIPSTRFTDITSVTSVSDALNKILYPFQKPTFTSFTISGKPTVFELGEYFSTNSGGSETFNWSDTNVSNISNNGFHLLDITNSYSIATGILPTSLTTTNQMIPYPIIYTTNGSTNDFRIVGKDIENNFFQLDVTYTWKPRIFWGTSPNTVLSNSDILNLHSSSSGGSALVSNIQNSFTMNGNGQYIWIVMPASFGYAINPDHSNSKFVVNGLSNTFWNVSTMNFTNQYGYISSYNLYRSTSISYGTAIQINII